MSTTTEEKKKSRWVKGSGVARYSKPEEQANSRMREQRGWRHGAKVMKK